VRQLSLKVNSYSIGRRDAVDNFLNYIRPRNAQYIYINNIANKYCAFVGQI